MSNWKEWLEAGKKLAIFPHSIVVCPECHSDNLKIFDVKLTEDCSQFERVMYCVHCKAHNSLKMNGKEKYVTPTLNCSDEEMEIINSIISTHSFTEKSSGFL